MMFDVKPRKSSGWETINKNSQVNFTWESLLVAGDQAISNFLEGYELVVDLWKYMNRRDD
jgi:hypothetical protein